MPSRRFFGRTQKTSPGCRCLLTPDLFEYLLVRPPRDPDACQQVHRQAVLVASQCLGARLLGGTAEAPAGSSLDPPWSFQAQGGRLVEQEPGPRPNPPTVPLTAISARQRPATQERGARGGRAPRGAPPSLMGMRVCRRRGARTLPPRSPLEPDAVPADYDVQRTLDSEAAVPPLGLGTRRIGSASTVRTPTNTE